MHSFVVDPVDVVDFAYEVLDAGWTVLGSFHSHPDGTSAFSERDRVLANWGEWHVLGYRLGGAWGLTFARRSRCSVPSNL
jgi:proteasome lid subunit RPN8/RPN11